MAAARAASGSRLARDADVVVAVAVGGATDAEEQHDPVAPGAIWVAGDRDGTVSRIDPKTHTVRQTVQVGHGQSTLAADRGGVWVANRADGTLTRISSATNATVDTTPSGPSARRSSASATTPARWPSWTGRLWVAVAATGAGQRGGTLRVDFQGEAFGRDKYDPATSYATWGWQVLSTTNDGLTTYPRVGGNAGNTLLPNLAESLPTPSDGGRTYAFALRQGVRFSTGRPVRPSDVKRGIERSLHAEQQAFGLLSGIASIAPDDAHGTVVFRLKRPDPDFLHRLALPVAYPVPPGTPAPPRIVAGTGALPDRGLRAGPTHPARAQPLLPPMVFAREAGRLPDVIEARLGVEAGEAVDSVRAGRQEVAIMGTGYAELARLRRRDPGPIRDTVSATTTWIFLNTRVPPFDEVEARRAVS